MNDNYKQKKDNKNYLLFNAKFENSQFVQWLLRRNTNFQC